MKRVIFFDTETNGFWRTSSVLSVSAIKAVFDGNTIDTVVDRFERYYCRNIWEWPNEYALDVNGLFDDVIRQKRTDASYAKYFLQDRKNFRAFCSDADHFVAHNIAFDRRFLNFKLEHTFCTMNENTEIVGCLNGKGTPKWPHLSETASFYGIKLEEDSLHDSTYDTMLCYEVFKKMLAAPVSRDRVREFLG
jgi:DNA polymerase-3 subunit epsilon